MSMVYSNYTKILHRTKTPSFCVSYVTAQYLFLPLHDKLPE